MKICATKGCGKVLGLRNKSGMCRPCNTQALWRDPHFRARKARSNAATLARNRQNPDYVAAERARQMAVIARVNEERLNVTPEAIAKRVRTFRARKLSWCPPHLRDEYIRLMVNKHIPAAQAREIILAQWDADLARRKHAA